MQNCGTTKKLHKTADGWIGAGAGNIVDIHRFFEWMDDGREPDAAVKVENLDAIMIDPEGKVYSVDNDLYPYVIDAPFHSGGSGSAIALGAMAHGATAEEAVRITIEYSIGCGGPLQVLKQGE